VTIDNLSTGVEEAVPDGVVFLEGDCQDKAVIRQLRNYHFDAIYHIAGQSSGEISFDDPVYDLQTNTQSTLMLLKYALETRCQRFIYASSMSVYGDQPGEAADEHASTYPRSFYAVGKLASENYLRIYSEFGITTTALRFFNVYGPGQNMSNLRQGMVSIFLAQAINSRTVKVKGSKDRFRDFIYIDDVIDSLRLFLVDHQQTPYECYNICTGVRTTVEELIGRLEANLPFDITVTFEGSTLGDQFGIIGVPWKIEKAQGWKAKTDLDQGIRRFVLWALENQRGKKE
jgi:UDP-glucose 4-epimerase